MEVGETAAEAVEGDPTRGQLEDAGEQGPADRERAEAQGPAAATDRGPRGLAGESSPLLRELAPYPQEEHPGGPQPSQKVRSLSELYEVDGHAAPGHGAAEEGRKRSKRCVGGVARRQKGGGTCTLRSGEEGNADYSQSEVIDLRNA